MRMGCFVVISGLLSVGVSNTKYRISNAVEGMDNDKRLGEKDEIPLCLSLSLSLSLLLCVCTYLYIYRRSFPSNLTFTFTFTFTYTKVSNYSLPNHTYLTSPNLTIPLHKTAFSHHPIIPSHPYIHLCTVLYCTVSTICRQYLSI